MLSRAARPLVLVLAALTLFGACTDDDVDTAGEVGREVGEAVGRAGAALDDAWDSLRTDGERLIDEIKTADDPRAKEELLERCRDMLERLRKADSDRAGEVEKLCDRIRDADVGDDGTWDDVERRIRQLAS